MSEMSLQQYSQAVVIMQRKIDELEVENKRLTEELESHAWDISPAMSQAKIDELNATVERLTRELSASSKQYQEACDDAAKFAAEVERMRKLAAIGEIVFKHVDAMNDLDEDHTAEYELKRFLRAVRPAIDAALPRPPSSARAEQYSGWDQSKYKTGARDE